MILAYGCKLKIKMSMKFATSFIYGLVLFSVCLQNTWTQTISDQPNSDLELNTESSSNQSSITINQDENDKSTNDSETKLQNTSTTSSDQITNYLDKALEKYDKRLRPDYFGPATKVGVTILIISLSAIKEVEMEFTVDMFFRQTWQDRRLAYNLSGVEEISLMTSIMDNIWTPDTMFRNSKESHFHETLVPNRFIRIYPNGTIMTSTRLTLTASCPMNLALYPHDHQVCGFEVQSYGHTTRTMDYYWKGDEKGVEIALDSVTLPQYVVKGYRQKNRTEPNLTGDYFTLGIDFLFIRSLNHYIAQIYLPSFLVVVISYFALWMERDNSEPRLALGVTAVLTMTAIYLAFASNGPPISYIKAVDVYLAACNLGVFLTLLESVVLAYLVKKIRRRTMVSASENGFGHQNRYNFNTHIQKSMDPTDLKKLMILVSKVDVFSRILFPILFMLFHLVYCAYYLNASKLNYEPNYWSPIVSFI